MLGWVSWSSPTWQPAQPPTSTLAASWQPRHSDMPTFQSRSTSSLSATSSWHESQEAPASAWIAWEKAVATAGAVTEVQVASESPSRMKPAGCAERARSGSTSLSWQP